MNLQRIESTYGRLIPKPKVEGIEEDELLDEVVPIQDQIENLRTKISLKEKYNRVLTENFEESRAGASSMLHDFFLETRELRFRLMAALKSEQSSVQNALRTHRIFQLAMTERVGRVAIPWLDDKLFDTTKTLNRMLDDLNRKRRKLEDAERMVIMIEKWPRPGTLPWELAALDGFERLDNFIENIKIKGETSTILHSKYYNIKFILREEQGKYMPTLRFLESQLRNHKHEYQSLQQMLEDAIYFREESSKNLILTEKEASENRKARRKQMAKMKKEVDKLLSENHARGPGPQKGQAFDLSKYDEKVETSNVLEELKVKKEIVAQYRDRARRLVEVMRVSDLTEIPTRSRMVSRLGERLLKELEAKEEFRDLLLKQRNQLILILCHFRYSGQSKDSDFQKKINGFTDALDLIRLDRGEASARLQRYGDVSAEMRLSILATLTRLDERKRHAATLTGDVKTAMKSVYSKIKKLVKNIAEYKELFVGKEPERNYDQFVKPSGGGQPRFVRVGSPAATDESEEEDVMDIKVPNRQEIKNKSQRVIHQAILRRGLR